MKKLYRDTKNQKLCGVCAGVANYFELDPSLVRALWAIITAFGGSGLIAYIVCAIVIPEDPGAKEVEWTEAED